MNRRDLLRMPAALGAPLAAQTSSAQAPAAQTAAPAGSVPDSSLDAHQTATLDILADLIIPGAHQAGVTPHLELLLRDGPSAGREQFIDGLNWLEGYSLRTHKMPFVKIPAAQQVKLLETVESSDAQDLAPGRLFVAHTKALVTRIYIATQAGFSEINQGGRVPATFGCQHSGKEHA